jgi:hypothetical protein
MIREAENRFLSHLFSRGIICLKTNRTTRESAGVRLNEKTGCGLDNSF